MNLHCVPIKNDLLFIIFSMPATLFYPGDEHCEDFFLCDVFRCLNCIGKCDADNFVCEFGVQLLYLLWHNI